MSQKWHRPFKKRKTAAVKVASVAMVARLYVVRVARVARVESEPTHMVTNLPGNFFVTDFLSGASGHVIVTAEIDLAKE